eukprot:784449-Prorocentrum_minimum.AAC.1
MTSHQMTSQQMMCVKVDRGNMAEFRAEMDRLEREAAMLAGPGPAGKMVSPSPPPARISPPPVVANSPSERRIHAPSADSRSKPDPRRGDLHVSPGGPIEGARLAPAAGIC